MKKLLFLFVSLITPLLSFCQITASNSGDVCEGTPTFDLFATDAGNGATYEWKDNNNTTVSTDQNPFGLIVPNTTGSYVYTVVATVNGTSTAVATTTLIVYPQPTASFISDDMTICINSSVDLIIEGLPNSTVNYTDGTNIYSITIGPNGMVVFSTLVLMSNTTFTLLEVTSATNPACSAGLSDSVFITIGLPNAPTGAAIQDFTTGQTLADFSVNVMPGATITWYNSITGGTELPSNTTILVEGTTYYYSQNVNGCESDARLAVTAGTDLKTFQFDIKNLTYSPNPVHDELKITYSDSIERVSIYDMLGKLLYIQESNGSTVNINMEGLASGNYILQVTVKGITNNLKIIKN
jgi:hypothetical protein